MILRGVARGRTSHPANTPNGSTNAIHLAARAIAALERFDWGPTHPKLGRCHAHVTMINGGIARNVVPDTCEFWIDIRTTPLESHAHLFTRLSAALHCELHVHSDRLNPFETADHEPIVQAALKTLPGTRTTGSPAMSDMVFLTGIPAVKIGPGQSPRSHTPDEYIEIAKLEAGAAAYKRIVMGYFAARSLDPKPSITGSNSALSAAALEGGK